MKKTKPPRLKVALQFLVFLTHDSHHLDAIISLISFHLISDNTPSFISPFMFTLFSQITALSLYIPSISADSTAQMLI